eukprot:gene9079-10048_t
MGNFLSTAFRKLFGNQEVRILMVGLDNAGKTTILYQLRLHEVISTVPTIGFNVETVVYKNISFTVWDIGGQDKIRNLWRVYLKGSQGLIFVIDSSDKQRLEEAKSELKRLLEEEDLQGAHVLVFANKQDVVGAATVADLLQCLLSIEDRQRGRVVKRFISKIKITYQIGQITLKLALFIRIMYLNQGGLIFFASLALLLQCLPDIQARSYRNVDPYRLEATREKRVGDCCLFCSCVTESDCTPCQRHCYVISPNGESVCMSDGETAPTRREIAPSQMFMNLPADKNESYIPTTLEQIANCITHGIWIIPSIAGAFWIFKNSETVSHEIVSVVYGASLDNGGLGDEIAWLLSIAAITGVFYSYFFHDRYKTIDTLSYLCLGVIPALPLAYLSEKALTEVAIGGFMYIAGIAFFKSDGRIPFAHAIWHLFGAAGALIHFYAIWTHLYAHPIRI